MDYVRRRGVPVMIPVTEQDLQKPVFQKYWKSGVTRLSIHGGQTINKLDMRKFANLDNMLRRQAYPDLVPPDAALPPREEPYFHAERPAPNSRDEFSGSEYVFSLSDSNFRPFIERKDMCLVMFYEEPSNEKTLWAKLQLNKAARSSQRLNHGYATVNCTLQGDLCQSEGVCSTPMYKLYSKGKTISTIREVSMIKFPEMRGLVETAPVAQVCGP